MPGICMHTFSSNIDLRYVVPIALTPYKWGSYLSTVELDRSVLLGSVDLVVHVHSH